MKFLRRAIHKMLDRFGYEIRRQEIVPRGASDAERDLVLAVKPYTMTDAPRILGLRDAVRYVIEHDIPGSIVECGVWRGGSMMSVALTLLELGVTDRDLYLFDTYEGMTEPTEEDRAEDGRHANEIWEQRSGGAPMSAWCRAGLKEVQKNMRTTGYPEERMHFVPGDVANTIPEEAPEQIALLRLDIDWYESTRHTMEHLYPCVPTRGILLLDDYGHWVGAKKAVDEYFEANGPAPYMARLDYAARVIVKPDENQL